MTRKRDWIRAHIKQRKKQFVRELFELLAIKTVSTPSQRDLIEIQNCANWLAAHLKSIGLENVEVLPTEGNPIIYADWRHAPHAPTVMVYGHYDVQAADDSQFQPVVRAGNIYARGATYDKGQFFTHLKALQCHLEETGRLPCNVKIVLDGGEEDAEMGEHTMKYVRAHARDRFQADCVLISDMDMLGPGRPAIVVGLRGIASAEIALTGARCSEALHSGVHGGAAPNALQAAAEIVARCKDSHGRVQIPDFYRDIEPPSQAELRCWQSLDDDDAYQKELEARALSGEAEYSARYRRWARPTFEVHGIVGGHMQEGLRTIIPSRAIIKATMRLVPRQQPDAILAAFSNFVREVAPPWIDTEVRLHPSNAATLIEPDSAFVQCAAKALEETFSAPPVLIRDGGSIPIVSLFGDELKIPCVLMGWGLSDDGAHSASEKLSLVNFCQGIEAVTRFLIEIGKIDSPASGL